MDPEVMFAWLEKSNYKKAARELRQVMRESIPPVSEHGTNQHSIGVSDTKSSEIPDATYVIARLKRDNPELAQQVVEGFISPNAAAIQAGIKKKRGTFITDNPALAVSALLKFYTPEQLISAIFEADNTPNAASIL